MASDDLYLLDLRRGDDQAQWIIVPVIGPTPGRRYGHIINFIKPYLAIFGGNTGTEVTNDVWCLNVEISPFTWTKIRCSSETPPPRVYHSGAQCLSGTAAGMVCVFGGRGGNQLALNDTWGLRRHRDGSWDWVRAPYKAETIIPIARYQHKVLFLGSLLVAIGGRSTQVVENIPINVYDTETSEWAAYDSINRFRHACWLADDMYIYICGGFTQDNPNESTNTIVRFNVEGFIKVGFGVLPKASPGMKGSAKKSSPPGKQFKEATLAKLPQEEEKTFKLSNHAQVAISSTPEDSGDFANMIRHVSIDRLRDEPKKIIGKLKIPVSSYNPDPNDSLYSMFLNYLMKPKSYSTKTIGDGFQFKREQVIELAKECYNVMKNQPPVVSVRLPVKIFGNIHGNFTDLMRFFDTWRAPTSDSSGGDIESFAYIFLGNFVDRGTKSLETICLLFALKVKYPDQIHLIRGSHENRYVNAHYGLGEECKQRLKDDITSPNSIFNHINNVFSWMPLAAIVEHKILCVHAGIGPNFTRLDSLQKIKRPLELDQEHPNEYSKLLYDVLWSDPATNETDTGYKPNSLRDNDNIVTYGVDKVAQFLTANKLEMIIRSHEVPLEGIKLFANSQVITISSCSNYCGTYNNLACMLVIPKTFEIIPKLIPLLPEAEGNKVWNKEETTLNRLPPTPPR